jgi:hypothetical protein
MAEVAFGVALNVLALAAIGIGPALCLLSTQRRVEIALAISPVVGFSLTSIVATYLVLLDKPVSVWGVPWVIVGVSTSLALCCASMSRAQRGSPQISRPLVALFVAGLLLTLALVVAPMIVGGLTFTVLRGNGTDAFNYMTLAGYLDHEPLSWASKVDPETLIRRHPSYWLARELLKARWTTSAMLAWTARIAQLPLYRFEYGFSILSLVVAFGPALWLALLTGLAPLYALLLGVAVCVGFWAQFVLDTRAVSQIDSLPLVLLLAVLLARIEDTSPSPALRERILLAVILVALVFLYPEIVPMVALALVMFVAMRLFHGISSPRRAAWHGVSAVIVAVGILPALSFLAAFLTQQASYAAGGQNTWHHAYFSWLYSSPLTGLWGLSCLPVDERLGGWVFPNLLQGGMLLLGLLLSLVLAFALIHVVFFKQAEATAAICVSASFILAACIQCLYLLWRNQLWAAGKGLSFGYPFFMIVPAAFGLRVWRPRGTRWVAGLTTIIKGGLGAWLLIQVGLGFYRIGLGSSGKEYPNYILQHGEYRRHDWNVAAFSSVLRRDKYPTVWVSVSNSWVSEYLGLAFGWETNLVNLDGVTRENRNFAGGQQRLSGVPDYLIVDRNSWLRMDPPSHVVAQVADLELIKTPPEVWRTAVLLRVLNPNAIERDSQGSQFFWMGGDATLFRLFAPGEGDAIIRARFLMGPSLPERSDRNLLIESSANDEVQYATITETSQAIRVPVRRGLNVVALRVIDQPSVDALPNGDKRPLLLRVDGLQVDLELAGKVSAPRSTELIEH